MEIFSTFPPVLEAIGLIAFSVSGVIAALQKQLDLVGVIVLAVTTACGGGILRDLLLNVDIPVFFTNYTYITLVCIGIVGTLIANLICTRYTRLKKYNMTLVLDLADAIGLATFCTSAALMVITANGNLLTCVFISAITGCGGGIMRDLLVGRTPLVFSGSLYAIPCIAGAIALFFLYHTVPYLVSMAICFAVILLLRLIGIFSGVGMPKIKYNMQ